MLLPKTLVIAFINVEFPFAAKLPVMKVKLQEEIGRSNLIDTFNSEYRVRQVRFFKMLFDDREGFAVYIGALG